MNITWFIMFFLGNMIILFDWIGFIRLWFIIFDKICLIMIMFFARKMILFLFW